MLDFGLFLRAMLVSGKVVGKYKIYMGVSLNGGTPKTPQNDSF